ncbi:hypothetical protein NDU88_005119 [Pleurodeles waltl]|uniref:Uncharacterized protein n=1 Tax=Pleurodeles waltl TaxID=8319 RepID=A0AAV7LN82_PLEWA|nr:hypothetical protein NDU88_005119 [Pleurodeles waltl]
MWVSSEEGYLGSAYGARRPQTYYTLMKQHLQGRSETEMGAAKPPHNAHESRVLRGVAGWARDGRVRALPPVRAAGLAAVYICGLLRRGFPEGSGVVRATPIKMVEKFGGVGKRGRSAHKTLWVSTLSKLYVPRPRHTNQ